MSVSRSNDHVTLSLYRSRVPGNAKIAGLTADLGLSGVQFNLISALFYVRHSHLIHENFVSDRLPHYRFHTVLSKYPRKPPAASVTLSRIQFVAQEHGTEVLPAVEVE